MALALARSVTAALLVASPSLAGAVCTAGAKRLQVPEECTTIGTAVTALADGGTIDLAPGTYTFGTGGLNLSGKNKAMTLAARTPGAVSFSGQGLYPVVRVSNGATNGKPIVFEGIRFVDGHSSSGFLAGGVTLKHAEVTFADCAFEHLVDDDPTTGGGALGLYGGSRALVVRSSFVENRAKNQGGALYVYTSPTDGPSSAWIEQTSFERNTTAAAGFTTTAAGGAIYARNARVVIADSSFVDNAAGFVGGAIYLWGDMGASAPFCNYDSPSAALLVARSTFEGNTADDAADENLVPQTFGGAIHAENCTDVRIYSSLFAANGADWGGALSLDHARLAVEQTTFRQNFSTTPASGEGYAIGGAVLATAIDPGADDIPNGSLSFSHTLFQGRRTGDPTSPNSQMGGCLKTIGDGSQPTPIPASARVAVSVSDSAFFDCAVDLYPNGPPFVGGGAVDLDRTALALTNVLFARDAAVATGAAVGHGSGVSAHDDSRVLFGTDVVFAGGTTDGPEGDVSLQSLSTTSGGSTSFGSAQTAPLAGILVAAPARPSPGGPFAGDASLTWGFSGPSATLDGAALSDDPKNGTRVEVEGDHALVVTGLGSCARCAATIAPPVYPWTSLDATPLSIAAGGSSTLAWTTPDGSFLSALVDRGVGEVGSAGSAPVSPGGSSTYRRFAVTREGGALAEARVYVDEPAPAGSPLFASGFESGFAGWAVSP